MGQLLKGYWNCLLKSFRLETNTSWRTRVVSSSYLRPEDFIAGQKPEKLCNHKPTNLTFQSLKRKNILTLSFHHPSEWNCLISGSHLSRKADLCLSSEQRKTLMMHRIPSNLIANVLSNFTILQWFEIDRSRWGFSAIFKIYTFLWRTPGIQCSPYQLASQTAQLAEEKHPFQKKSSISLLKVRQSGSWKTVGSFNFTKACELQMTDNSATWSASYRFGSHQKPATNAHDLILLL